MSQYIKKDRRDLTKLTITWSSLEQRLEIAKKDLKEAKKHAEQEEFAFEPENFDPAKEAENLEKIVRRIRILIEKEYTKRLLTEARRQTKKH